MSAIKLRILPLASTIISSTGTVGTIVGSGPWTATITGMSTTTGLLVGSPITATNGSGSLYGGAPASCIVASIVSATSITYTVTGGTTPTAGSVTNISTGSISNTDPVAQFKTGIVTKSSPLTVSEVDNNFDLLNAFKMEYHPTTKYDGTLYSGTADPSNATRLNYDGSLFATNLTAISTLKSNSLVSVQQNLAAATTTTLDVASYNNFYVTMGQNTTFAVSGLANKIGSSGLIILKQDATGGRTFTKATEMKTPLGGAAIAQYTTANSMSVISYYVCSSSEMVINYIGNFA